MLDYGQIFAGKSYRERDERAQEHRKNITTNLGYLFCSPWETSPARAIFLQRIRRSIKRWAYIVSLLLSFLFFYAFTKCTILFLRLFFIFYFSATIIQTTSSSSVVFQVICILFVLIFFSLFSFLSFCFLIFPAPSLASLWGYPFFLSPTR